MPGVTLHPVTDRSGLRRFLDVDQHVHAGVAGWVPPLRSEVEARLRFRRNPLWRRADGRLLVARRGREMVGRIAAAVDRSDDPDRTTAVWGWFACADDPAAAAPLLDAAAQWCRDQGAERMVGPVSLTPWEEVGLLVEAHDEPPVFPSPWHPPWAAKLVEEAGCRPVAEAEALRFRLRSGDLEPAGGGEAATGTGGGGGGGGGDGGGQRPRLRSGELERALLSRAGEVLVALDGLPLSWRPTVAEVRARYRRLRPLVDPALAVEGDTESDAGGFVAVAVPDANEIMAELRGRVGPAAAARVLARARRTRQRASVAFLAAPTGDGAARAVADLRRRAAARGFGALEVTVATSASGLQSALAAAGAEPTRRYRLYGRALR